MRACLAICAALGSSGCGLSLQAIIGWNRTTTEVVAETRRIEVNTMPPGAEVKRVSEGESVPLGTSPLVDTVTVEVERTTVESRLAAHVGVAVAELVVGIGLLATGIALDDPGDPNDMSRASFPLFLSGGLVFMGGAIDMLVAFLRLVGDGPEVTTRVRPRDQRYVARGAEREAERIVDVSQVSLVELALPGTSDPHPWIVAVMTPEERRELPVVAASTVAIAFGDQLRAHLGMRGIRTIDRGVQAEATAALIEQMKLESYHPCFDDSCQIELGKALAASHILRSRIDRLGTLCVVSAVLVDLRTEVAVRGFSSPAPCEPEALILLASDAVEELATVTHARR